MSFSNDWPTMPKLGPVNIHSVGNQNYSTGFSIRYTGLKDRPVTLYVNHHLTDDLQLAFMHREDNQYRYTPARLDGDAFEAERAVRQFMEVDAYIERKPGKVTTKPNIWSNYFGAATVAIEGNHEAIDQLKNFLNTFGSRPRADNEAGFGLNFRELAEKEIAIREARLDALNGVFRTLQKLDSRTTSTSDIINAIVRPDLKFELEGFSMHEILPPSEVENRLSERGFSGRVINAGTWNHRNSRLYAEGLSLSLYIPNKDPFKQAEIVKPVDVTDDDILIFKGPAVAQVMERDMSCFKIIAKNPRLLILNPNGNTEGRVANFTPAAFDSHVAGMKI
jgi:hypothetical protein